MSGSEEEINDSGKKLSFKHEWNNFSIYCWTLMEKCMVNLNDEEKEKFKQSITSSKSNLDRVKIVLDNVEVMNYLRNHIEYLNNKHSVDRKKDNKFSHNCKKIGDTYFNKKRFQKALKFYSKAIMFFDKDEEELIEDNEFSFDDLESLDETISLSQLYICRAKALTKLEKLTDAYVDFKEALALEPEIKDEDIDIDNLALCFNPNAVDFKLSSQNDKMDGASSLVRMDYCDEKGRMIKAESRIEEGDILFMEEPYVHWLRPSYFDQYCHQCLKRLSKHIFVPCDHCTEIRFCSSNCKEIAWKRYHHKECKYLPLLKKWPSGHMALRLILRDGLDYALEEDRKPSPPLSEWPALGFKANYSSIKSLTGEDSFTDGDYYCPLIVGCILIALLFELNNEIKKDDLEQFSAILIKSIMQILENTFMIYDYDIRAIDEDDFLNQDEEPTTMNRKLCNAFDQISSIQHRTRFHQMSSTSYKIGVGLYSATSLIPHSCDNNSNKFYFGSSILIVAAKSIDAGDEVNIEYGVHYKMNSLKYRKEYLKTNFGFDCKCNACLNGYENEGLSFKCIKCQTGALIRNQDQTNYCLNCDAENLDMTLVDELVKKAEDHFQLGIDAYKQNNIKKAEQEFRAGEKICTKIYYNDVKLQFIKCELSHLYLVKKNYPLAYQYLLETLPINKNLYGENSIELLTNHIELACLAIECIENLNSMKFSVKQTSQKLFRQLLIKMKNRSSSRQSTINKRQQQNQQKQQLSKSGLDSIDLSKFDEIDKRLFNGDEILKWKIIFKRHYQVIVRLYARICKRNAKIASDDSINSLYKLSHLKKFLRTIEN